MIFGRGKTVKGLGFTVKPEHTNKTKRGAYGENVMRAPFTSVPVCGAGAKKPGFCAGAAKKIAGKGRKYRAARQEKLGNIVRAKIRDFSADFRQKRLVKHYNIGERKSLLYRSPKNPARPAPINSGKSARISLAGAEVKRSTAGCKSLCMKKDTKKRRIIQVLLLTLRRNSFFVAIC